MTRKHEQMLEKIFMGFWRKKAFLIGCACLSLSPTGWSQTTDSSRPVLSPQQRRASAKEAVVYRKVKIGATYCHVVEVDLRNPHVQLEAVRARDLQQPGRSRTFAGFIQETQPLAAITGTFFDTATGSIICNLVRDGQLLEQGRFGHTFALNQKNEANWLFTAGKAGWRRDWKDCEFAVSSGPTLVRKGQLALDPWSEGFSDPGLFRQASRTGLATTQNHQLLLVSVNSKITLGRFARIMRALGAQDAINLDGGSSTALYARGQYLSQPGRRLTNVLTVNVRLGDPIPRRRILDLELLDTVLESNEEEDESVPPEDPPAPAQVDLNLQERWL